MEELHDAGGEGAHWLWWHDRDRRGQHVLAAEVLGVVGRGADGGVAEDLGKHGERQILTLYRVYKTFFDTIKRRRAEGTVKNENV